MKRLLTTTALGMLLVASPALAQTSQDSPGPATPPTEQSQPDSSAPPAATPSPQPPAETAPGGEMNKPEASAPDAASSEKTALLPSELQASKLIGVSVENASGETIGEINDIVLSEDGSAKAALVGVGGFLGLGQKNIAIDLAELNIKRDDGNNLAVTVAMSAESLEAMPAYQDPNAPAETSTGPTGMTSPSAPGSGSE